MKKFLIVIVNIAIMATILTFVVLYAGYESRDSYSRQIENLEALETEFDRFNEYYPNVELVFTKVDDYSNMIGTVLKGNDAPDIYVNYFWMYGREQYSSCIEHAENLADPALNLNLDCICGNIILNTDDGTLPMVPLRSNGIL